jgi:hypothetical protein
VRLSSASYPCFEPLSSRSNDRESLFQRDGFKNVASASRDRRPRTLASTNNGVNDRYNGPVGAHWMDSDLLLHANQAFRYRFGGSPAQKLLAEVIGYRFEA